MPIPNSVEELDIIKGECKKIVNSRAAASGASALTPIPGLDIAADLAIFTEMIPKINREFGLSREHIRQLDNHTQKIVYRSVQKYGTHILKQTVGKQLKEAALKELGKRFIKKEAGKQAVKTLGKYIPFVGQAISASIGYALTQKAGNDHIESCYNLVQKIMEERRRYELLLAERRERRLIKLKKILFWTAGVTSIMSVLIFVMPKFDVASPAFMNQKVIENSDKTSISSIVSEPPTEENDKKKEPANMLPPSIILSLPNPKIGLYHSEELQIELKNIPEGTAPELVFSSSNPEIVSVNKNGVITGKSIGKATISANAFGQIAKINVEVTNMIWSANIEDLLETAHISWSDDGEWLTMDSYLLDRSAGTIKKEFVGPLLFLREGLGELEGDYLKMYNSDFKATDEKRLIPHDDYYAGYGLLRDKYDMRVTNSGERLIYTKYDYQKCSVNLTTIQSTCYDVYHVRLGAVDITPDDKNVVFASGDIYVMDIDTGETINVLESDSYYGVALVNPSVSSSQLAALNSIDYNNNIVDIWNMDDGSISNRLEAPDAITDMTYNPSGRLLAISCKNGSIYIYETTNFELVETLITAYNDRQQRANQFSNEVLNISFAPNGRELLAIYSVLLNEEPNVILWNVSGNIE
ncbi:Ig-like domain-containing protein [Anaerobacillus sp. CMMVII]|uniref:WD40 domain-containing protein n=1 Tax=Anaerobacillus sp. CMMVII TaxID=2755588 RepID=UPI0021B79BBB|nr:Ig-like domain-containing protein [Anaerobacillus sp. CMMVII]MCT8137602.1 Ig-like domain-containing protein [Anaerobacillus sp. CMMVII]